MPQIGGLNKQLQKKATN